jgi:uncharacterized protein YoxC
MTSAETLNVMYIILLLCASALCIALIIYLYKITKSIKNIESEVRGLAVQAQPLLTSAGSFSEKLNNIAEEATGQVEVIKNIISDVKDHADKILELEAKVRKGIEDPVSDIIKNLSAILNGINTFWKTYKGKHQT